MLDDDTKEVRAVTFNYARVERTFFDKELEADFKSLSLLGPKTAEVGIVSRSRDEKTWIVSYRRDDGPTEYAVYNQPTKTTKPLFVSAPKMLQYKYVYRHTSIDVFIVGASLAVDASAGCHLKNFCSHSLTHSLIPSDYVLSCLLAVCRAGSLPWKMCASLRGMA